MQGTALWTHREAAKRRIYYPSQLSSKLYYSSKRYFSFEKQINQLIKSGIKSHYRNKKTKTNLRFNYLCDRRNYYDYQRQKIMISMYRKHFNPVLADRLEEQLEKERFSKGI